MSVVAATISAYARASYALLPSIFAGLEKLRNGLVGGRAQVGGAPLK